MVAGKVNKVSTIRVAFPDFHFPHEEFIQRYHDHVPDVSLLLQNGIGLGMIQDTISSLIETPVVNIGLRRQILQLRRHN